MKLLYVALLASLMSCANSSSETTRTVQNDTVIICNNFYRMQGQKVSWGNELPVKVWINKSVPVEFRDEIKKAIKIWNKAAVREIIALQSEIDQTNDLDPYDFRSVIYFDSLWKDTGLFSLAETRLSAAWGQIKDADIHFNIKYFTFSIDSKASHIHFKSVLLHELGHLLGLDHNTFNRRSIMWSGGHYYGEVREVLELQEIVDVQCEYSKKGDYSVFEN